MSSDVASSHVSSRTSVPSEMEQPPPLASPSGWDRRRRIVLPVTSIGLFGLFWEYGVRIFDIPRIIMPPFSDVARSWYRGFIAAPFLDGPGANFIPHLWVTFQQVVVGFLIGLTLGIVTGAAVALSRNIELLFKPFIVAIYSTPKIAIAPLLIIVLGFGKASKIAVVLLVAWMPIFTNVVSGLRAIEPARIDLLRVMGANPRQILTKVRIPMSMPYLFSGIRIAVLLSLLAAVAAEFVGAQAGMGYIMILRMSLLDTSSVLALILTLSAIGFTLFTTVEAIQKRVLFWSDS